MITPRPYALHCVTAGHAHRVRRFAHENSARHAADLAARRGCHAVLWHHPVSGGLYTGARVLVYETDQTHGPTTRTASG
jgi:hypothetical protein